MSGAGTREAEADLLRVIGHETRLTILAAMRDAEQAVGAIEAATGIGQPGLSQQLSVLRKAGLVETRREGKQVFYRLVPARLVEAQAAINALIPGRGAGALGSGLASTRKDPIRKRGGAAVFARIDN